MRLSIRLYQEKGIEKVMSKKTNTTTSLSENTKKTIIITAICAVAIVILAIALALILKPATDNNVVIDDSNNGTSPATIKNGSFFYYASKKEAYPKTAQNWTMYTNKIKDGAASKDLEKLATYWICSLCGATNDSNGSSNQTCSGCDKTKSATTTTDLYTANENALYGIVDLDKDVWTNKVAANLSGLTVSNPGIRSGLTEDTSVFMIAAKTDCNVAVMSESSFSVASNKYVKISAWLNVAQLKDGDFATIAFQKAGTTSIDDDDKYIVKTDITNADATEENGGWVQYDFYIFNKYSQSKSVKMVIGIGNVYEARNAMKDSVLFIDDITYETVSSAEYHERYDDANSYVFEAKENTNDTTDYSHTITGATEEMTIADYKNSDYAKVDGKVYSPFVTGSADGKYDEKFSTIYRLTNNGIPANDDGVFMSKTDNVVVAYDPTKADCVHISFWLRLIAGNKVTTANVIVEKQNGAEWEKIDSACITGIEPVEDITTADANCGWNQYHIYLQPSELVTSNTVRIRFFLGDEDSKANNVNIDGTMFVSNVAYDLVSPAKYSSASSGTYTSKYSFSGDTASVGITNGSFTNEGKVIGVPADWTHVFAGNNAIYKDGNTSENPFDIDTTLAAIEGTGLVKHDSGAPTFDDTAKNYLRLTNVNATSQGYLSSTISLSAKNVYVVSVLAKGTPYIYLINNSKTSREEMIVAKIEGSATTTTDDSVFAQPADENGWTRYYFVVVTGNEAMTLRLALFNGKIDGTTATGTVEYDCAMLSTAGSYSVATNADDDTLPKTLTYTANSGYDKIKLDVDKTTDKVSLTIEGAKDNVNTVIKPTDEDWATIRKADEKTDDTTNDDTTDNTTTSEVDFALLFSVISSILLVAALAVVFVLWIFKKKKNA